MSQSNTERDAKWIRDLYQDFRSTPQGALNNAGDSSSDDSIFTDEDTPLTTAEALVNACYRQYQEQRDQEQRGRVSRTDAMTAQTAVPDNSAEDFTETIINGCQSAIRQRRNQIDRRPLDSSETVRKLSWLGKLIEPSWRSSRNLMIGAGSFATIAIAVVALSVFRFTQPTDSIVQLTGVSAYDSVLNHPVAADPASHMTDTPQLAPYSFSSATDAPMSAYWYGSLEGSLTIAVSENNPARSIRHSQTLLKHLASTSRSDLGAEEQTYKQALLDLQLAIELPDTSNTISSDTTGEQRVTKALYNVLSASPPRQQAPGMQQFQSLGAWTRLLLVTLDTIQQRAEQSNVDTKTQKSLILRVTQLLDDAPSLHEAILNQPGLLKAQRLAITNYRPLLKLTSADLHDADRIVELTNATIAIDKSFRL